VVPVRWLVLALALACGGATGRGTAGGAAMTEEERVRAAAAADASVRVWDGPVAGVWVIGTEREVKGAWVDGDAVRTGGDALRGIVGSAAVDDHTLARLAILFLESENLLREPLAGPADVPAEHAALAGQVAAPARRDDRLVYWRLGVRPADPVRVTVDLGTMTVTGRERAAALAQATAAAADPIGAAEADLASPNVDVQARGVATLAACGHPAAAARLARVAREASTAGVRRAAVLAQRTCRDGDTTARLAEVLAADADAGVRRVAVEALSREAASGDAAARAALAAAARTDPDPDVRYLAGEAARR
jgi:hypothetical protein